MFGEFIQCEKHGEEGMRHDEKHGYWCELCELGYPRSVGQPNTGLQADGADTSPEMLSYCGWCGYHVSFIPGSVYRCPSCGGNSWLRCSLGCTHERPAAKA